MGRPLRLGPPDLLTLFLKAVFLVATHASGGLRGKVGVLGLWI